MCVNEEVFSDAAIRGQLDSMDYIKKEYEHRLDLKKTNSQESAKDDSDEDDENEEDYIDEDDDVNKLNQKDSEIREDIVFQRDDPQVEPKIFEHNDDQYKQEHIQPYNSEIFEDSSTSAPDAMMVASEFVALWDFIVNNKERCILYFCVSIAVTIIILLLVFICRYSRKSDSPKHEKMLPQRCGNTHHGEMSLLIGGSNGSTPLYFNPSDPEMYSGCSGSGSYPYTDVERIYSSPSYAASIGLKEPDDSRISVPTFMHYDAQITPFHKLAGRYN
uniref:Neurexin-3-beta n=1 Tax=Rhabditophanes sp. KR3021 TaxID=114890 RepID=A0AC35TM28_9BILA